MFELCSTGRGGPYATSTDPLTEKGWQSLQGRHTRIRSRVWLYPTE